MIAHAGGIDELAIFLFPIIIGTGFWLLTRQRKHPDDEGQNGLPDDGATEGEPTRISSDQGPVTARDRQGAPDS